MTNGTGPDPRAMLEARLRELRDEVLEVIGLLRGPGEVRLGELHARLAGRVAALPADSWGGEIDGVKRQMGAMLERIGGLAPAHPEPVASDALGLPGDAKFLEDMANYLGHLLGEADEG